VYGLTDWQAPFVHGRLGVAVVGQRPGHMTAALTGLLSCDLVRVCAGS
jgi:hypothetical protein